MIGWETVGHRAGLRRRTIVRHAANAVVDQRSDPNWQAYTGNYHSPSDSCTSCPYVQDFEIEQMMDILDDNSRNDSLLLAQQFAKKYAETVDYTLSRKDLTDEQRRLAVGSLDTQSFVIERAGRGRTGEGEADTALREVLSEETSSNEMRRQLLSASKK